MKRIALLAVLALSALAAETKVEVKELTKTQQDALAVARARLDRAQKNLEMVEDGIRKAHGAVVKNEEASVAGGISAVCQPYSYKVGDFIYPKWIKLTTETYNVCGYAFQTPAEVKPIP
jgi:hypothetical protein